MDTNLVHAGAALVRRESEAALYMPWLLELPTCHSPWLLLASATKSSVKCQPGRANGSRPLSLSSEYGVARTGYSGKHHEGMDRLLDRVVHVLKWGSRW